MEEQLAALGHLVADEQVEVAEPRREQEPHRRVVERDPGRAGPARLGPDRALRVALAGRIVELVLLRPDDDVRAGAFAEVDPGMGGVDRRRATRGRRRQVADQELRLALAADLVDRDHGGPDAVREADPLVDPAGRVRVLLERQLARRQHHLARQAVDRIAVRVDVGEVVVLAHGLELVERRPQRTRVPQPRAGERVRLLGDLVGGQDLVPRERDVAPAAEVVGEPRHRDVVADVALFLGVLVGLDGEALDGLRVEAPDDQRGDQPDPDGQAERPDHPGERPADEERRGHPGDDRQHVEGEELGVLVGEADAGRDAPGAVRRARACRAGSRTRPTAGTARRGRPGGRGSGVEKTSPPREAPTR